MIRQTKYIRKEDMEAAAASLIAGYSAKFGEILKPPIPVEEILECHLGLNYCFEDLSQFVEGPDILGAIAFEFPTVWVDLSLDPSVHPTMEGRYRFTVAHEVAHWELHRDLFLGHSAQGTFFEAESESIVCRDGAKDAMEWQADYFAGHLLMPTTMVYDSWESTRGNLDPYFAKAEIADLSVMWRLGPDNRPAVEIARQLAKKFKVSGQAMQIRLIQLGLIRTEEPEPGLFTW